MIWQTVVCIRDVAVSSIAGRVLGRLVVVENSEYGIETVISGNFFLFLGFLKEGQNLGNFGKRIALFCCKSLKLFIHMLDTICLVKLSV